MAVPPIVKAFDDSVDDGFVVCPFDIAIDTREQAAWGFRDLIADARDKNRNIIVKTERKTLQTGDYSIVGHESSIAIERKEKGDLFHCMGADRERFERQVQRLNELPNSHLIIEADWKSVWSGHPNSQLKPKVVHRTVISWTLRYRGVHWWLCPSRAIAEATAFRILESYWKKLTEEPS